MKMELHKDLFQVYNEMKLGCSLDVLNSIYTNIVYLPDEDVPLVAPDWLEVTG